MQEKEAKKEGGRGRAKKATKKSPVASRDASTGPTGVRKRVVAENGKILVVDSLGDVYLEEEDEEGNANEYLLDVSAFASFTDGYPSASWYTALTMNTAQAASSAYV
jgi:hypothetical protein